MTKVDIDITHKTIENFVRHCNSGYYDNVIFHRVIKGFMLRTGDPLVDGTGGERERESIAIVDYDSGDEFIKYASTNNTSLSPFVTDNDSLFFSKSLT